MKLMTTLVGAVLLLTATAAAIPSADPDAKSHRFGSSRWPDGRSGLKRDAGPGPEADAEADALRFGSSRWPGGRTGIKRDAGPEPEAKRFGSSRWPGGRSGLKRDVDGDIDGFDEVDYDDDDDRASTLARRYAEAEAAEPRKFHAAAAGTGDHHPDFNGEKGKGNGYNNNHMAS